MDDSCRRGQTYDLTVKREDTSPAAGSKRDRDQYLRQRDLASRAGAQLRQRVESLLDPGSFSELDIFAGLPADAEARDDPKPAACVAGFGAVQARHIAIYAFDPADFKGAAGEVIALKVAKVQEASLVNRIPILAVMQGSGGKVDDGLLSLAGWAAIHARLVRASGAVPQLCLIDGEPDLQARQLAELSDVVLSSATVGGQPRTDLQLPPGSDGAAILAGLLSYLPASADEAPPFRPWPDGVDSLDQELQKMLPLSGKHNYDMRDVVARIVDAGDFLELGAEAPANLVTGLCRLGGNSIGLVANQPQVREGLIDVAAASKAARFIRFCDAFGLPLVFLVDTPGFAESEPWLMRHGAQLLYATAEANVPKLTVVVGQAVGLGYAVMGGKQLGADLVVAWPTADIGKAHLQSPSGEALHHLALERGYVDDVIEPGETRRVLLRALAICLGKTVSEPDRKHGNVPL